MRKILILAIITNFFVHEVSFAQCISRFTGNWKSSWGSETGNWFNSPLEITQTKTGIYGKYNNGIIKGTFSDRSNSLVEGKWYRKSGNSGGSCQEGTFVFSLQGDKIDGKWAYCNDKPRWTWVASKPRSYCPDTITNPVPD